MFFNFETAAQPTHPRPHSQKVLWPGPQYSMGTEMQKSDHGNMWADSGTGSIFPITFVLHNVFFNFETSARPTHLRPHSQKVLWNEFKY